MKDLIDILRGFNERRTKTISNKEEWKNKSLNKKYEDIADWFRPCAEQILCNGYFLVDNGEEKYIIDLGAIELYYHEEDGDIKDHIMYHTNEKFPDKYKKIISKYPPQNVDELPIFYQRVVNNEYPFFSICSFNLHQSGIDVTFENNDNQKDRYRASFLIRSYRMVDETDFGKNILYDPCSSHIYDDLYYSGLLTAKGATIKWVPKDKKVETIIQCPRINVADYYEKIKKDKTKEYVKVDYIDKIENKIQKEDYLAAKNDAESVINEGNNNNTFPIYFNYNSKYYKQDMRLWQFRIKGIQEIGTAHNVFYENATPIKINK